MHTVAVQIEKSLNRDCKNVNGNPFLYCATTKCISFASPTEVNGD